MRETLIQILQNEGADAPTPEAMTWLNAVIADQTAHFHNRSFYYSFSGVSRHFDKRALVHPTEEQLATLAQKAAGFTVEQWDQFRLARVILLTVLAEQEKEVFLLNLQALLNTADLRETQAIYSAFPLLPCAEQIKEYAVDGLRSNIVEIYDSIALGNPFPAAHFTEEEWNQMVLKALFIHRPLYRIVNLDTRTNAELAEAVSYLAHERWAAGRTINPEAWRCCVGYVTQRIEDDLKKLADSGECTDLEAVALVISSDPELGLGIHEDKIATQFTAIEQGNLTWTTLGHLLETKA